MSLLVNASRFVLFGLQADPHTITLQAIAKRKAVNVGRRLLGLPPNPGPGFKAWLQAQWKKLWAWAFGHTDQRLPIPADLPVALYHAINNELRNRGGLDKATGAPTYWANPHKTVSSPFFWSVQVDFAPGADPGKLLAFEQAIEEQIKRAGFDYNIRPRLGPTRIEVDKPRPPAITLADCWGTVAGLPTDKLTALFGATWKNERNALLTINMTGEDFSAFLAGRPGSGKTQQGMSILLSMAYANSPDRLSMVIIDPKAVDFRPFAGLPHLSLGIVTEPEVAANVLQSLADEMDSRTQRAARGNVDFLSHTILVYIDEMADLLTSLEGATRERVATNIQRLTQKGRGVGFIVIGATQRVYDIPKSVHGKMSIRCIGRMLDANDSAAATGIPGTTTNKLPGRGSFELYSSDQTGLRLQGPFVADANQPGYDRQIGSFVADIVTRWANHQPYWRPGQPSSGESVGESAGEPAGEPVEPVEPADIDAKDQELIQRLGTEYAANPAAFSVRTVRRLGLEVFGKEPRHDRAKAVFDRFLNEYAQFFATV